MVCIFWNNPLVFRKPAIYQLRRQPVSLQVNPDVVRAQLERHGAFTPQQSLELQYSLARYDHLQLLGDIGLNGEPPQGARPDLSVEGRVDIEVLDDVLFVDRPASCAALQRVDLFRVEPGGEQANRVQVQLGRASVRAIEIVDGLTEGEQIIVSDTRRWDEHDRLQLK